MMLRILVVCLSLVACVQSQCSEVCYDEVGCFTNCPPFGNFPLPRSPSYIGATFNLYTQRNPIGPFRITPDELNPFEVRKTVFLTHGFVSSGSDEWILAIKTELLNVEDLNVVIIDWEDGAFPDIDNPFEAVPAANSQVVARKLRNLVQAMKSQGLTEDQVSCVGHSVGAHLCAFFGKEFTSPKIGRITGLDPAGDIFSTSETRVRLNPDDAVFVDAIHTDAWSLVPSGIDRNVGQQDFWPNYGNVQPACVTGVCSHFMAIDYYLESIQSSCGFVSRPCRDFNDMFQGTCANNACSGEDCGNMGYYADLKPDLAGTFLLITNAAEPYCQECCL